MKNKELVLAKLDGVFSKIAENNIDAWEDNLQDTKSVVILEDFSKNDTDFEEPSSDRDYKYNGWLEDLQELRKLIDTLL